MKNIKINKVKNLEIKSRGNLKYNDIGLFEKFSISAVKCFLSPHSSSFGVVHNKTEEIFYIIRGKGIINIESREFVVESGDYLHIDAGTNHRFETKDDSIEFLAFLSPALDSENPDMISIKKIKSNKKILKNPGK